MANRTPSPASKLVLIVEDDPGMLEYFERVVRESGYRAATATDGLDAVKKMRSLKPDAGVVDLMLPRYGGIEMLYELRRGATASIPLLVVTARFADSVSRATILEQPNVKGFFVKPVSAEALAKALRGLLGAPPKDA